MENEANTDVDEKQQTEKKRKAEHELNQQPPTKQERRDPIPSGAATDSQGPGAQAVYEEEQRVAVDRTKVEGEDEEYDGEDLYSGCWLSNLLQKEAAQQYYASLSTFHFRIACDGCGAYPFQGVRYKCGHCPSFDLCSKCEAETTHDESHVFLKIKRPFHDEPPCALLPDFYNV
ncbi:Low affinity potassium transporter [Balamuthia mandrillaris]